MLWQRPRLFRLRVSTFLRVDKINSLQDEGGEALTFLEMQSATSVSSAAVKLNLNARSHCA